MAGADEIYIQTVAEKVVFSLASYGLFNLLVWLTRLVFPLEVSHIDDKSAPGRAQWIWVALNRKKLPIELCFCFSRDEGEADVCVPKAWISYHLHHLSSSSTDVQACVSRCWSQIPKKRTLQCSWNELRRRLLSTLPTATKSTCTLMSSARPTSARKLAAAHRVRLCLYALHASSVLSTLVSVSWKTSWSYWTYSSTANYKRRTFGRSFR